MTKCLRNEPDLLKNLSIIENMVKEQGEEPKDTEAKKADQTMKAFQKKNENAQRRFEEASEQGKFRWRRRGRRRGNEETEETEVG